MKSTPVLVVFDCGIYLTFRFIFRILWYSFTLKTRMKKKSRNAWTLWSRRETPQLSHILIRENPAIFEVILFTFTPKDYQEQSDIYFKTWITTIFLLACGNVFIKKKKKKMGEEKQQQSGDTKSNLKHETSKLLNFLYRGLL